MQQAVKSHAQSAVGVSGEFLTIEGERYYAIRNVDRMAPFFMSIISSSDHWLFVSSSGGLSAGRVSPDTALFPYIPVDRIHESNTHTGSKTVLRVRRDVSTHLWDFPADLGVRDFPAPKPHGDLDLVAIIDEAAHVPHFERIR